MPLKGNLKQDVAELIATNHVKAAGKKRPMKQILAIAYSAKRRKK